MSPVLQKQGGGVCDVELNYSYRLRQYKSIRGKYTRWSAIPPIEMTVKAWSATEIEYTYKLLSRQRLISFQGL
jgi:hypothetical protein